MAARRYNLGAPPATFPNGGLLINPATGSTISYMSTGPDGVTTAHYQDGSVLVVSPPATPAVTPSGTPVSTQTGTPITLVSQNEVVLGVWKCVMSDGSSHYCDNNQNPISYTPPPAPVATPATSSQPTSVVSPAVTPQTFLGPPVQAPPAVTPSGAPISTTSGTPTSGTVISSVQGELNSLMTWLEGSLIGGIPNWLLLGGAVAGLMMFGGDGGGSRRRR